MLKDDFSIKKINNEISAYLSKNELNYCKLLFASFGGKLSVTAEYRPPQKYCVLGSDLNPIMVETKDGNNNYFYYGVSPFLDNRIIMECISGLRITNEKELDIFVKKHCDYFMLHAGQEDYLVDFAKLITITMLSHFGIKIKAEAQQYHSLVRELQNEDAIRFSSDSIKTFLHFDEESGVITVSGCPASQLIERLDKYSYVVTEEKIGKKNVKSIKMIPKTSIGKTIYEVYREETCLIRGKVFYSGVLLKPNEIRKIPRKFENDKISSVCLCFEKSTYGTVCTLDNNYAWHPFLQHSRDKLVEFIQADDDEKKRLSIRLDSIDATESDDKIREEKTLEAVNEYLKKCSNVNQIGISSNIISSEGLMLLGKRKQGNIDEGCLYPCVNGNAEIVDQNVSFYHDSVYEDYPTITIDGSRIDFFGEISREAYAEIGQNISRQAWVTYGLTLSGNIPNEKTYSRANRRMHFNLIMERCLPQSFEEIKRDSIRSTESFETTDFLGIKIIIERSRAWYVIKSILAFIKDLAYNKDLLEAIAAIAFLVWTVYHNKSFNFKEIGSNIINDYGIVGAFTLLLSFLITINGIVQLIEHIKRLWRRKGTKKTVFIFKGTNNKTLIKGVLRKLKKFKFHSVAYASFLMYLKNSIYKVFFEDAR